MSIPYVLPKPKRVAQGFPLTSLQHDSCHTDDTVVINALVDAVNGLIVAAGGGSAPAGVIEFYAGTTLPAGNWLWCDGSAISRTTYATLFTAIGTTFGVGNGTTTFNLPKMQGRAPVCANPLNSISADTPTLGTYTLGQKYGAEKYNNAAVAVTASVPALSVPHSSLTGSVTFPTFSAGVYPLLAPGAFPSLTGGALPSLAAVTPPTLGIDVTGTISTVGHLHSIGQSTVAITEVSTLVDTAANTGTSSDTINKSAIGALFTFDAGTYPSLSAGSFQTLTSGTLPSLAAVTPPSSSGGDNTVTFGGTQTTSITSITGATANIVDLPTVTPELCLNCIIKF